MSWFRRNDMPVLALADLALFCRLADPQGVLPEAAEIQNLDAEAIRNTAIDHRVYSTVVRKLSQCSGPEYPSLQACLKIARQDLMYIRALTMALKDFGHQLTSALTRASVEHVLVKGEVFAQGLYDDPFDRPYTDVDILLPEDALPAASDVMKSLGLVSFTRDHFDRSIARQEHKWGYERAPHLFVELHANLVHFPSLRRSFSFAYEDYQLACDHGRRPYSGYFVVAVVHAAAGHRFDLLRLVVDILQALRRLPEADLRHLEDVIVRLRLQPEVAASLSLVSELFPGALDDHPINALRHALRMDRHPRIINGKTVFHAPGNSAPTSLLTRTVFRFYQRCLADRQG